jgi:acyl-CoA thioesterase-2
LQLTFLQGARPEQPIEYSVERLQQARRLATCQVCAGQGTGMVASAHVSFHSAQPGGGSVCREWAALPAPEQLPTLAEWARAHPQDGERIALRLASGPILDVRPIDPEGCFGSSGATRQTAYWMRLTQPLADEGCLSQAALAYMSACGFNAGLEPGHYLSNLNHSLWFHAAKVDTGCWLLFVSEPPSSLGARQLVFTHIYDRQGVRVASMSQETLNAPLVMA